MTATWQLKCWNSMHIHNNWVLHYLNNMAVGLGIYSKARAFKAMTSRINIPTQLPWSRLLTTVGTEFDRLPVKTAVRTCSASRLTETIAITDSLLVSQRVISPPQPCHIDYTHYTFMLSSKTAIELNDQHSAIFETILETSILLHIPNVAWPTTWRGVQMATRDWE